MFHLSEVLRMPVLDADGALVGKVEDLQVDPASGKVEKILVRERRHILQAPWAAAETFSIELRRCVLTEPPQPLQTEGSEGEAIWLKRDVLDRQIIDIHGRKVVRVNDILLETVNGSLVLRRVEVGLAGAVRRLLAGVISPRLVRQTAAGLSERSIPWDYVGLVDPRSARIQLKVHQQLARMHPADLADILEDLGRMERRTVVSSLDPETAAQALAETEPNVQAAVVEGMQVDQAADLLEEMQPNEAADILGDLPEHHSRELLLAMQPEDADDVRELLNYGENTAGGLMTTEFFKAQADWTVGQTLAALRDVDADLVSELDEIPIVGAGDRLLGVAPLVRLVRAYADAPVTAASRRESRAVTPATPFDEVAERFQKYNLRALAVVDEVGNLVGLISVEDVLQRLAAGG
jgi:flagellar motility protein MotE (MotC chaperone)/sporulation protein YlmC with PRC-barrel domain